MDEDEDKDIAESQKLSDRDKKQIQDGACVNCAVATVLFMIITLISLVI